MFFRFCHYCHKNTLWAFVKQIITKDGRDSGWDKFSCSECNKMSFMQIRKIENESTN